MVQRDLRLMVLIVVRTALLTLAVVAVRRVVTAIIHAARHVFLHFVPFF